MRSTDESDLLARAIEEFDNAVKHYEKAQAGLGVRFGRVVDRVITKVMSIPMTYPRYPGTPCRYRKVPRFPFSLIYRHKTNTMLIVAIAHHKRKPGYWKNRLRRS